MKRIAGVNYLNQHKAVQDRLDVPEKYVLVYRDEWGEVVKFFRSHPELLQEINKPTLTKQEEYIMEEIINGIKQAYSDLTGEPIKALKGVNVNKSKLVCNAVVNPDGYTVWSDTEEVYVESHVLKLMFKIIY